MRNPTNNNNNNNEDEDDDDDNLRFKRYHREGGNGVGKPETNSHNAKDNEAIPQPLTTRMACVWPSIHTIHTSTQSP